MLTIIARILAAGAGPALILWAIVRARPGAPSLSSWAVLLIGGVLATGALWSLFRVPPRLALEAVWRRRLEVAIFGLEGAVHFLLLRTLLPPDLTSTSLPAAILLVCASRWLNAWALRSLLAFVTFLLLLVLGLIQEHEARFGTILADSWLAIFQTDFDEARSYSADHFSLRPLWLAMAGAVATWLGVIARRLLDSMGLTPRTPLSLRSRLELSVLALGVLIVGTLETTRPLRLRVQNFQASLETFSAEVEQQRRILASLEALGVQVPADASLAEFEGTVVLVLGESTTRRNMSLYGYNRETTPRLDALRDKLLIHQDTISPHSHTVPSLKEALTVSDFDGRFEPPESFARSILIELRRAGFKTWWLSNQNEFGVHDNPISLLGKQADVPVFRRKSGKLSSDRPFWDHDLLPLLDQALLDPAPRRFVVLHLYSTHASYCSMIPPEYREVLDVDDGLGPKFFGRARDLSKLLNCYDNAVRYVDGILGQVADRALARSEPTVMLFFSDHGENPTDWSSHHSTKHSTWHVEIPHLWLFNPAAREARAAQVAAFAGNVAAPFKSSDMFHLVLDLVGADSDLLDRTRSLFSSSYEPRPRRTLPRRLPVAGVDGVAVETMKFVAYDERHPDDLKDHLGQSRVNLAEIRRRDPSAYRKLWAHRVNSIGKLLEAKEVTAGVEIDVTFNAREGRFRVFHGGEEDIGLTLEELLGAGRDRPELGLWLDWKNASPSNIDAALARLDELDSLFTLRERTLVETGSGAAFSGLRALSAKGYRHSHYLNTTTAVDCAANPREAACGKFARETAARVKEIGAGFLSFDHRARPFVLHHRKTFEGLRLAAWDTSVPTHEYDFAASLPDLEPLDVLLVPFRSIFTR